MVNAKIQTDVSILFVGTGASVTTEKRIPGKKRNMKSPAMSSPIKYHIPNQDINRLITEKYASLPPINAKYPPGFKPLFNDTHDSNSTEDDPTDSTDYSSN